MNHPDMYRGEQIVILGLAKSGFDVAKRLHERGAIVTVNDKKERHQCPEASDLEALGICVVLGAHPDNLITEQVKLLVKNPGIPYSAAPVQRAIELGIDVVTEIEVGYHLCAAPIIGITGSNGKTTTTTWVGHMLEDAGLQPIVAGNIGTPFSGIAADACEDQCVVLELSSFQLKGTQQFHPHVACLLNIAETHLDYHGGMEDYISSKAKLFANMDTSDIAILNADDPTCSALASTVQARIWNFSSKQEVKIGTYVDPSFPSDASAASEQTHRIVFRDEHGVKHDIINVDEIGLPGRYNVDNALAAVTIAVAAGAKPESLRDSLRSFKGVEHRLEWVREHQGVQYYNNSKATNTIATQMALEAFQGNIVLIAGGLDRGLDFKELVPYLRERVKAVVTLGETRHIFRDVALDAGLKSVKVVDNKDDAAEAIQEAVSAAEQFATEGDIVLLSPACASWDMFPSYEIRGSIFKEAVHSLK
ncbi:UDP-N-acetylmuramoyl-L-alanine--D-glutamate ligase [Paenibacillus sp. UMB4589-SE434]|uniref:UDP-N-acetylmuramoyl-L-alanine--D-glutamate ligase n=1 Tax=Paenibacillus sp. UMB4589-SE434 TaxID=3046314 RepID=UPI00254ECB5B|nr:UDP-N-acetylmuramoyl-L-alanine--D-glutamate ligase [Paenibacillus sp. UMB4589-SE434]MDK8180941.1 UDP-N-acetylmuramoyl-L-alanine--D-glutamate ligase [Paenibacillus sp. UMB4589-SE434]